MCMTGEIHQGFSVTRSAITGANLKYDRVWHWYTASHIVSTITTTTSTTTGQVSSTTTRPDNPYKDCKDATITTPGLSKQPEMCSTCFSGGAGVLTLTSFVFILIFCLVFMRFLVLWDKKHLQVPWLGETEARWGSVERVFNYLSVFFYWFAIGVWVGTCFPASQKLDDLSPLFPTGFIYNLLAGIAMGGAVYLIRKLHEETK